MCSFQTTTFRVVAPRGKTVSRITKASPLKKAKGIIRLLRNVPLLLRRGLQDSQSQENLPTNFFITQKKGKLVTLQGNVAVRQWA